MIVRSLTTRGCWTCLIARCCRVWNAASSSLSTTGRSAAAAIACLLNVLPFLQVLVDSILIDLVPRLKPTGACLPAPREHKRITHAEIGVRRRGVDVTRYAVGQR